jgi:hypothetical protein
MLLVFITPNDMLHFRVSRLELVLLLFRPPYNQLWSDCILVRALSMLKIHLSLASLLSLMDPAVLCLKSTFLLWVFLEKVEQILG